jgi:hypothetical protein
MKFEEALFILPLPKEVRKAFEEEINITPI